MSLLQARSRTQRLVLAAACVAASSAAAPADTVPVDDAHRVQSVIDALKAGDVAAALEKLGEGPKIDALAARPDLVYVLCDRAFRFDGVKPEPRTRKLLADRLFGLAMAASGAATDVDPRFLLEEMQRVLNARFKSVSISTATPETDTARADVTMIWDTRVKLGKMSGQSNVVDVSGIFMDADRQVIDTVKGTGSTRVPYPAFTLRARAAMTAGLEDFAKNLDGATKLISVLSGGAPTTGPPPVAPPTPSVTPSTVAPLPRIPSSSQPGTVAPLPSGSSVDPK